MSAGEASVEGVVDEDRRLDHHEEVAEGQIDHEHVGWCPQTFRTANCLLLHFDLIYSVNCAIIVFKID